MIPLELKQLQCFVQICEERSITKAARTLFLSPPALSKIIGNLETEVGVQLLLRRTDGVLLTPAGDLLLERSQRLLDCAAEMLQDVRLQGGCRECDLHVGICHSLLNILDSQVFAAFRSRYPSCTLKLEAMSSEECHLALKEGLLDGACASACPEAEFCSTLLCNGPTLLAISEQKPLSSKPDLTLCDLREETFLFLILPQAEDMSQSLQALCQPYGFVPNCEMVSTSHWMLADRIASNRGIHFFPHFVRASFEAPGIVLRRMPGIGETSRLFFLTSREPSPDVARRCLSSNIT